MRTHCGIVPAAALLVAAGTSDDDIGQVLRTAGERVGSRLVQSAW